MSSLSISAETLKTTDQNLQAWGQIMIIDKISIKWRVKADIRTGKSVILGGNIILLWQ